MSYEPIPEQIPAELRELDQWVNWRFEERNGKETKIPVNATTGHEADCTDRREFASFNAAMQRFKKYNNLDGIGFVFHDDDPFVGIDLDDCITDVYTNGSLFTQLAQDVLRRFPGTYAECSPSGTGLKLWIRGKLPISDEPDEKGKLKTGRKIPKLGIETYCRGRYFTVTSQKVVDSKSGRNSGSPPVILDHNEELQKWFAEFFPSAKVDDKNDKTPAKPVSAGVMEIVEKASASRNGDKFRQLWAGDCSEFGDDHSSGDLAFCSMLAFWCGGNANLIDEVFRASGLMRDKWERDDYRSGTIKKAVDGCREYYDWDRQGSKTNFVINVIESCKPDPEVDQEPDPESDQESQAWPKLIPIAGPEPEPMECSDFPPCIAGIIEAVVEFAEVPVELPGLMALGVLATAAQKKYEIAGDGSYREPLNLFVCPALDPGNRKTSVVAILTKPLRRWEQDQRAELAPIIREADSERRTAEKRIEHLRTKASKAEDSVERVDLQREIDAIERELPPVPVMPLLTTDDCTPEHTATLLSHHGERLAIVSDEGGIFDIVAGRYSRGVPNLDVFLQAHAGSPVRVHRGSREPVDLQNPCLTIAISCQPYVLAEMGDNKAFRGRGLLARFLFAIPKSNLGFRTLQPKEIPSPQLNAWNHVVYTMLDRAQQVDDFGSPKSQILYLSPGAYRIWKAEQRSNEIDMRPAGSWADNTGWASKYPGAVLRIAGILHCADCTSCGQDPATKDVEESTMLFALQLGRKIKSHSRQAFGMMQLTDDQKFAHKIVEWIRRDSITEFTGRECSIHCNSAGSVKELDEAFELLINHGWIRPGQKKQPDGRGRPSHPFEVNPAIAQLDDINDKSRQSGAGSGIVSFLSSVSAQPIPRPELQEVTSVDVDDYEFDFPSDRRG